MIKYIISFLVFFSFLSLNGQDSLEMRRIMEVEQEILSHFQQIYDMPDSEERDSINNLIIQSLKEELSTWDGFYYQWDALEMIGRVSSDDNSVKIFTWYLQYSEKSYKYFGLVAYHEKKFPLGEEVYNVVELKDHSTGIKDPENKLLSSEQWYGAVYYNLETFTHRRNSWYALIGFDFNDNFSNKKIIEILSIDKKGKILFGEDIHLGEEKDLKRVIFEYSSKVAMMVNYDERLDMIVYDHLRPYQPFFEGNYRFYAPDGSYDGLRFEKGEFYREEDLDARNY